MRAFAFRTVCETLRDMRINFLSADIFKKRSHISSPEHFSEPLVVMLLNTQVSCKPFHFLDLRQHELISRIIYHFYMPVMCHVVTYNDLYLCVWLHGSVTIK